MIEVRQVFPRPRVADVEVAVREGLRPLIPTVRGRRIAVTAGSRGIRDLVPGLRGVVGALREAGADPIIVAAMGSHGGGTAEGQRKVLTHLGVTGDALGVPVESAMDVAALGTTPGGWTVYLDRHAAACDGIVVVNRIKPHTAFREPFGSGLMKMLAVGLGKAPGAAQAHRGGAATMPRVIREVAQALIDAGRVIAGVALIENAYDETGRVEVVPPPAIPDREPALFRLAWEWMPRLPVEEVDVLVVDEIGKNFSGTGMDVNIIGRWRHPDIPDPETPRIARVVALRLSAASEGNAQGVGLADVVTARLAGAVDFHATYLNAVTSTYLQRAFLPLVAPSDRAALQTAVRSLGLVDPAAARIVRIRNTLDLETCWVSPALLPLLGSQVAVRGSARSWQFAPSGDLADT